MFTVKIGARVNFKNGFIKQNEPQENYHFPGTRWKYNLNELSKPT